MNSPLKDPSTRPLNKTPNDPDYIYPVSKNPYWEKLKSLLGRVFSENETEKHRGHWREQFAAPTSASNELHVEMGCNGGHVTLEWARLHPERRYIGIDWKFKQIFFGAEKAQARGLKNLIFFRAHLERLPFMFGPGEIDTLYLFFPDPWQKKSQLKNRTFTAARLRAMAPVVKMGGTFEIKTDHAGYFEWMEAAVAEVTDLWQVERRTVDLHEGTVHPEKLQIPAVTLFERVFIRDKKPIHAMWLRRIG